MTEHVEITREGSRIEIAIDRPEKRNALTVAMYAEMADALVAAEADDAVLSVVISGRGAAFCAGNDLVDFQRNPPQGDDSPVARFLAAIARSSRVLIAAVQGPAVGVGATMLLHCDHVVAAEDAALQFAFVRMALVPEAASSLLLPRAVGRLAAAELMLTGDPVPSDRAHALGLVSRVVPEPLAAARAFAQRLDGSPPEALRETKRLLGGDRAEVEARMAEEGAVFRRRLSSPEFAEAARAFMERRKPVFGA